MRDRDLLSLVGDIHATVLTPGKWEDVVTSLESAVGGTSVSLVVPLEPGEQVAEAMKRNAVEWHAPSLLDDFVEPYLDRFRFEDPFLVPRPLPTGGGVYSSNQFTDLVDLGRTAIYNDWMKPQDLAPGPDILLYQYDAGPDVPAVHFFRRLRRKPFGPKEMHLLEVVLPHIRQAIRTRQQLEEANVDRRAFFEVLDRLTLGVLLVDFRGKLLTVNRSARALLDRRDGLEDVRGELRAADIDKRAQFERLLLSAAQTGSGRGFDAGGAIALPRASGARDLVALVVPLRALEGTDRTRGPAAAVYLTDYDLDRDAVIEVLQGIYPLTKREAALACDLAEGHSLAQAAGRVNRAVATERDRLKEVFSKTHTTRQAELVRLVLKEAAALRRK